MFHVAIIIIDVLLGTIGVVLEDIIWVWLLLTLYNVLNGQDLCFDIMKYPNTLFHEAESS